MNQSVINKNTPEKKQGNHLVILKSCYLEAILKGAKTIESRFTKTRRPFWGKVMKGDRLFFKKSSGDVVAEGQVLAVREFEGLTAEIIERIREEYDTEIQGSVEYWQSRMDCKYGILVWFDNIKPIGPIKINKHDWRAWVVLNEKDNFGLLKA